jgi:hypothetical protein
MYDNMGVLSYRQGRVLFWDSEHRTTTEVDPGLARNWEKRSKERGKPSHFIGGEGCDQGSTLEPPDDQKLEGPWINGKEPADIRAG